MLVPVELVVLNTVELAVLIPVELAVLPRLLSLKNVLAEGHRHVRPLVPAPSSPRLFRGKVDGSWRRDPRADPVL